MVQLTFGEYVELQVFYSYQSSIFDALDEDEKHYIRCMRDNDMYLERKQWE